MIMCTAARRHCSQGTEHSVLEPRVYAPVMQSLHPPEPLLLLSCRAPAAVSGLLVSTALSVFILLTAGTPDIQKTFLFSQPWSSARCFAEEFFSPFCSLFLAFNFGGVLKVLRIFIWILLLTWVSCCDPGQQWTPSKLEMTLSLWELGLQVWPPCPASQLTQSQRIAIFIWHTQSMFRSRTRGGQASRIHSWALTVSLFLLLLLC